MKMVMESNYDRLRSSGDKVVIEAAMFIAYIEPYNSKVATYSIQPTRISLNYGDGHLVYLRARHHPAPRLIMQGIGRKMKGRVSNGDGANK